MQQAIAKGSEAEGMQGGEATTKGGEGSAGGEVMVSTRVPGYATHPKKVPGLPQGERIYISHEPSGQFPGFPSTPYPKKQGVGVVKRVVAGEIGEKMETDLLILQIGLHL